MPPRHNQQDPHSMQPPSHPSSMPLDPTLAIYPSYFPYQQPQQQHQLQQHPRMSAQHLPMPTVSSPSSQGSESHATPPMDQAYPAANGSRKRHSSALTAAGTADSRKKARQDDDDDSQSPTADKDEAKAKPTRGSR